MQALKDDTVSSTYLKLRPHMDEKARRLWAAAEAERLGYGGVALVSRATGMTVKRIKRGIEELNGPPPEEPPRTRRVRRPGAGAKPLAGKDPGLLAALEALLEPATIGDPQRPLRWTCKSTAKLARELNAAGHRIGARTVAKLLKGLGYSLQGTRKRFEGSSHPDRDAQFAYINTMVEAFQARGLPTISVDTKKKELVGNYANGGREWRPKGEPPEVEAYDFVDPEKGKAIPYGIYDTSLNTGWVSVGRDHDTAEFAVASIASWWANMGERAYPEARELLVTADGGGSNGSRNRLWKLSLQRWADREGMRVVVCHFPPGTSKWNWIEHRMFCHITRNWRGRPLTSHEVVVDLIGSTTTEAGLRIESELDPGIYPTRKKVSDADMASLRIERADFHGEWNYMIEPRNEGSKNGC